MSTSEHVLRYLISLAAALWVMAAITYVRSWLGRKRFRVLERLHAVASPARPVDEDDVLQLPLARRIMGLAMRSVSSRLGQIAPAKLLQRIEDQIERAGNPRGLKPGDLLAAQGVLGLLAMAAAATFLRMIGVTAVRAAAASLCSGALAGYLPWFYLTRAADRRKREIRRSLPDMIDFLIVSLEAGLSFDLSLIKVVERFRGPVAEEFQRAVREMQLGKPRKDALRDLARRVDLEEVSTLVNAVNQAEQLGVGVAGALRVQADLIRDRRQQLIEEQAMKAPVKMLFPLIFLIFPSIFVVILGPAILNLLSIFSRK